MLKEKLIKKTLSLVFLFLIIIAVIFFLQAWHAGYLSSIESLRTYIKQFGLFGPIILILIQLLQVVFPVIPGFLGCIVGTGLFGAIGGFFCNYVGIGLGSVVAFLLARCYGIRFVKQIISEEKYCRYAEWISSKKSFILVLWLSILLPLAPDDFYAILLA